MSRSIRAKHRVGEIVGIISAAGRFLGAGRRRARGESEKGCRRENSKRRVHGAAHAMTSRFAETWTHRWLPAPVADTRAKVRGRARRTGRTGGEGGRTPLNDTKPDTRARRAMRVSTTIWYVCACVCVCVHARMFTRVSPRGTRGRVHTRRCVRMVLTGIVIFLKVARRRTLDDRVIQVHVRRRLVLRRERHLHCIISARGSPCMHINMYYGARVCFTRAYADHDARVARYSKARHGNVLARGARSRRLAAALATSVARR